MSPMRPPNETLAVVQTHVQRYNNDTGGSCVASGIEMILKLERLVPESYYEIQDRYKYQNTGFGEFHGKTIEGLIFTSQRLSTNDGSIQKKIAEELREGRYVLISLPTGGWHIFLVFLNYENDFHAVSKWATFETGTEPMVVNLRTTLVQFFQLKDSYDILTYAKRQMLSS